VVRDRVHQTAVAREVAQQPLPSSRPARSSPATHQGSPPAPVPVRGDVARVPGRPAARLVPQEVGPHHRSAGKSLGQRRPASPCSWVITGGRGGGTTTARWRSCWLCWMTAAAAEKWVRHCSASASNSSRNTCARNSYPGGAYSAARSDGLCCLDLTSFNALLSALL